MDEDRRTATRPRRVRGIIGGLIGALLVALGLWWFSGPSGRPGAAPARRGNAVAGAAEPGGGLDAPPTRAAEETARAAVAEEMAAKGRAPLPRGEDDAAP